LTTIRGRPEATVHVLPFLLEVKIMTRSYVFCVAGTVADPARAVLADMRIEDVPAGAVLRGDVADEWHLLEIMARCRTLGLFLVSARWVLTAGPGFPDDLPATRRTTRSALAAGVPGPLGHESVPAR
jgi:hypothetical protein